MRFVAGGRIPLLDADTASKDYEIIIQDIRAVIKPLQQLLFQSIHETSAKENPDINDIELMSKKARWVEESEGEFCQLKTEEGSTDEKTYYIEFLESWSLYFPREDKELAENALDAIQAIIDQHTQPHRSELNEAIQMLTSADTK